LTETRILAATTNRGKVAEMRAALAALPVVLLTLDALDLRGRAPETGTSFLENARAKSLFYSRKTGLLTLAEDSGLEVESLGGAPGIYSARFSGSAATDETNIRKLLRLMRDYPREKRKARFICCAALSRRGRVLKEITGRVHGFIALEKKGTLGFGYDPVFWYPPLRKHFGELEAADKNRISHRGRALKKLAGYLAAHPELLGER
jgi:XTP/dITP diphosphohydrolase